MHQHLLTSRWRIAGYIVMLAVVFVLLYIFAGDIDGIIADVGQSIETLIIDAGVYSYLVYVLMVTLLTLTPVVSSSLWLVAGFLFNPVLAIGLTVGAEFLGAMGNYIIGQRVIGGFLEQGRFPRVAAFIMQYRGKMTGYMVFMLGVMPISTTNVTAYAAALTDMPFVRFVIPWTFGVTVPVTFTILLGHSASLHSPSLALMVLVVALPVVWYVYRQMRLPSS